MRKGPLRQCHRAAERGIAPPDQDPEGLALRVERAGLALDNSLPSASRVKKGRWLRNPHAVYSTLDVTSRQVVGLFLEQLRFEYVPALHRLQGRLTVQG